MAFNPFLVLLDLQKNFVQKFIGCIFVRWFWDEILSEILSPADENMSENYLSANL
jgi:hypothetical protein